MTSNIDNKAILPEIQPRAGLMRGVRIWYDPDSILANSFEERGQQMGYVYIFGEGSPAVFDGTTWHPVCSEDPAWEPTHDDVSDQHFNIIEQAKINPKYLELATHLSAVLA